MSIEDDVQRAITRLYDADEFITVARVRQVIDAHSYSDEDIEKTMRHLLPDATVEWGVDDGVQTRMWLVDTLPW
jgi:hypothetical protein